MKKFYLFLVVALGANISKSQVAEVFSFPSFTAPQDYIKVTPDNLFNNKYYYLANDNSKRTFLYYTEDENLPVQVAEVSFNPAGGSAIIAATIIEFKATESLLYFVTRTLQSGSTYQYELWRTDGTTAGTIRLMYYAGASVAASIKINSELKKTNTMLDNSLSGGILFVATATAGTRSLWKTDGTVAGTVEVKNVVTTNGNAVNQNQLHEKVGSNFIFTLYNEMTFKLELWKTDGTTSSNLTDGIGAIQTVQRYMGKLGNKIYYYGGSPAAVYSTDGITATLEYSTSEFIGDAFFNNNTDFYYLSQTVATEDFKLYYVTGDIANKVLIANLTGIFTIDFANNDGVILKKSENFGTTFRQFFVTKTGTITENTNPLKPTEFRNYDGNTYVGAELYTDPLLIGKEIWKYNPTTSVLIQDIYTGSFAGLANSSTPKYFFEQNQNLYFVANVSTGRKLYTIRKDFTFTGSTDGLWSVPSNWNTNTIPGTTNNLVVPSGFSLEVNTNSFAKNISIASPINLTSGTLDIYGSGTLSNAAKITLNTNNLNLKGTNSTILGNETSYIITNGTGHVSVENVNAARGNVNLPIGTTTNYNPVSINNTGTADTYTANVAEGITNTTNAAVNATWQITEALAGGSNVALTLQWNALQEQLSFDRAQSYLGHYTGGSWDLGTVGSASGSNPYSFSRTGITSFSPFGILNNNVTLPLDFLSFSALKCNNHVCLNWKTANEQNVSHFEIERSSDGVNYLVIGTVPAGGNNYNYEDRVPNWSSKNLYYRIKQIDNDNRSKRSNVAWLKGDNTEIQLYPTLFTNSFTLQNNTTQTVWLQMTDGNGKMVLLQQLAAGTNVVSADRLAKGVYFYSVKNREGIIITGRIIKQ